MSEERNITMEEKELLKQAMQVKTPEELLTLVKEHGMDLTEEQAKACFDQLHQVGELSDDELDSVSGGALRTDGGLSLPVSFLFGLKGKGVQPKASGLVYHSTDTPKVDDLVYRPVKPITTKDDADTSGQIVYL